MKKTSVSLLAFAAALFVAPAAHADTTPGWYAGAGAGATFPVDPTEHSPEGKHQLKDHSTNLDLLANGGYAFANGLRVEGEYFHNQYNTKTVENVVVRGLNVGDRAAGGHLINNAVFANGFYDLKTGTIFSPYVGAGIGPDFVKVNHVGANGYDLNGSAVVAAYQGIAGVSAQLDHNWAVTADYRYVASFDPKVDESRGGEGRMDNASHNVVLSVRYSFGAPEPVAKPTPVVVKAVEPKAAAIAPVSQNYTVFFDFDKATLTPEAKHIIASAAQQYNKDGIAKIIVTGHTDTSGSAAYNQKLSERRAAAVKDELKKLGVETHNIKEVGVGKDDLLVPTADGVREAQNRRAEIVISK